MTSLSRPPFPTVLDSTIIAAARSCGQKANLEFIQHWKSREPSVHLHAGAAYAHGLERARRSFYEAGTPSSAAVAHGIRATMEAYGDFECPPDSAKSLERTVGAIEYYFARYPLDSDAATPITLPGDKRGIEFGFVEPLDDVHPETGDPLLYSGRMDMIVSFEGMTLGLDDKTTSQLGASWPRQWDLRCFSKHHELYTRSGWRPIEDITCTTEVMQVAKDGSMSFARPTEKQSKLFSGSLVEISGRRIHQQVTPNHRILLNKRRGGTKTVFAEELGKQDDKDSIPLAGRHAENRLPALIQRFLVAVQADSRLAFSEGKIEAGQGHRKHMPNRSIEFVFTKERKIARMTELLSEMQIEWKGENGRFYVSGFSPVAEIVDMFLDENKDFKDGYETMFDEVFLDELEHWDGWQSQYYTNSKKNALFVVSVASMNDKAASATVDEEGHWTVVLSNDIQRTLKSTRISSVAYEDQVYCVTVPTGYLLTRCFGMISVSGNSQFTGYSWGAGRQGIKLDGWLVRGVSILKSKYDTLQALTYRPQWQIDRWYEQLLKDIKLLKQQWESGQYDYNLDHACTEYGGCPFRDVCLMQEPQPLLEMRFQRRKWDPVERTETVL